MVPPSPAPRPSGPFVSLQASSFPEARDTYAFRISSSTELKIKDRVFYSLPRAGEEDSWSI